MIFLCSLPIIFIAASSLNLFEDLKPPTSAPTAASTNVHNGPQCNLLSSSTGALSFIAFSDWGTGNPQQKQVADQMSDTSLEIGASFMIAAGDNFYAGKSPSHAKSLDHSGITDENDLSWLTKYYKVYNKAGHQIPWYVVLGNHDWGTHTTGPRTRAFAQVEHSQHDWRWNMPDLNYTKTWIVPQSGGRHLQIVFIDTCKLNPNIAAGSSNFEVYGITEDMMTNWRNEQLAWIEETLAASTASWLFVVGHYHVYSLVIGRGTEPVLSQLLQPLLEKYHVTGYIHGHSHYLGHINWKGVNHINVGRASDIFDPIASYYPGTTLAASGVRFAHNHIGGFGVFQAKGNVVQFTFVDQYGNNLYCSNLYSARLGMEQISYLRSDIGQKYSHGKNYFYKLVVGSVLVVLACMVTFVLLIVDWSNGYITLAT